MGRMAVGMEFYGCTKHETTPKGKKQTSRKKNTKLWLIHAGDAGTYVLSTPIAPTMRPPTGKGRSHRKEDLVCVAYLVQLAVLCLVHPEHSTRATVPVYHL